MSASAIRRPQFAPSEAAEQRKLPFQLIAGGRKQSAPEVQAQKATRPRVHYAIMIMVGLAVVLASQLMMSILLAQGAYEISALKGDLREASRTAESLGEDIALLSSPQYLSANASSLGMVPSKNVAFLRLSDGLISGSLAVAGSNNAISNPVVKNSLLEKESAYLSGVLNLTQPAGLLIGETPLPGTDSGSSAEVSSSDATRGLSPVVAPPETIPVAQQ
ncbi:MAG: hypothetical protein WBA28_06430 [Microbacteriaceae bacterium]